VSPHIQGFRNLRFMLWLNSDDCSYSLPAKGGIDSYFNRCPNLQRLDGKRSFCSSCGDGHRRRNYDLPLQCPRVTIKPPAGAGVERVTVSNRRLSGMMRVGLTETETTGPRAC